jgi:hypothetical protein
LYWTFSCIFLCSIFFSLCHKVTLFEHIHSFLFTCIAPFASFFLHISYRIMFQRCHVLALFAAVWFSYCRAFRFIFFNNSLPVFSSAIRHYNVSPNLYMSAYRLFFLYFLFTYYWNECLKEIFANTRTDHVRPRSILRQAYRRNARTGEFSKDKAVSWMVSVRAVPTARDSSSKMKGSPRRQRKE